MAEVTVPLPPKAFISYSWSSSDHTDWVVNLATRLRSDGVDVILDRWDLKEGQDQYHFMEQMVTDPTVKKVLVICDRVYAEKAGKRTGGVGTEAQLISAEVYSKVDQEKFIPIIREKDETGKAYTPPFLATRFYIDFTDEEQAGEAYERLIRNIFGRPELRKPELGKPPPHIFVDDSPVVKTAGRFARLREAAEKGKPNSDVILRDYLHSLADALEEFQITGYRQGTDPEPDEIVIDRIDRMRPYRDEFIEFCVLYADYRKRPAKCLLVGRGRMERFSSLEGAPSWPSIRAI